MARPRPTRTTRTQVKAALRQLWLRSRERAAALKREQYTCERCGKKQSRKQGQEQKIEVHHREGVGNWGIIIDLILQELLCDPGWLEVLCPECHKEAEHGNSNT